MFDPILNLKRAYPLTSEDVLVGKTYYMYDARYNEYRKVFISSGVSATYVDTKEKFFYFLEKHLYFQET